MGLTYRKLEGGPMSSLLSFSGRPRCWCLTRSVLRFTGRRGCAHMNKLWRNIRGARKYFKQETETEAYQARCHRGHERGQLAPLQVRLSSRQLTLFLVELLDKQ